MWKCSGVYSKSYSNLQYTVNIGRSRINTIAVVDYGVIEPDTVVYLFSMALMLASS